MWTLDKLNQQQQRFLDTRYQKDKVMFEVFKDTCDEWTRLHEVVWWKKIANDNTHTQQKECIDKLPKYWYYVLTNSHWLHKLQPSKTDLMVIQYLKDIYISDVHSKEIPHSTLPEQKTLRVFYTLHFIFSPNQYMKKLHLFKKVSYTINDTDIPEPTIIKFVKSLGLWHS